MRTTTNLRERWISGAVGVVTVLALAWTCATAPPARADALPGCCLPASGAPYQPNLLWGAANHGCLAADTWSAAACPGATPAATPTAAATPPAIAADSVCCGSVGPLWPCDNADCVGPMGAQCTGKVVLASACVGPGPTPTATPTATPTFPPQPAITLTPMGDWPIPFTYRMQWAWIQKWPDGSYTLTCNAGHLPGASLTPPALGTSSATDPGECKMLMQVPAGSSPPRLREVNCANWSTFKWESGTFVLPVLRNFSLWTYNEWVGYGNYTGRTSPHSWGDNYRDASIERVILSAHAGTPSTTPFEDAWPNLTPVLTPVNTLLFVSGIVDIFGQDYLYAARNTLIDPVTNRWIGELVRYTITPFGGLEQDGTFAPVPNYQIAGGGGWSTINLDATGKLLLTADSTWPPGKSVDVWQSADWGRTWSKANVTIPAPEGSVGIWDCHMAVAPGGAALTPMWGICQTNWSVNGDDGYDWSTAGHWRPYLWAQEGAQVPAKFTAAPTLWPAVPAAAPAAALAARAVTAAPAVPGPRPLRVWEIAAAANRKAKEATQGKP